MTLSGRPGGVETAPELLERSEFLVALEKAFERVGDEDGEGRLVLVGGEAGVGKTALLRSFCAERGGAARVLWGACDPLSTPRPLGPFLDVAAQVGGELRRLLKQGAKLDEVFAALMETLSSQRPTILVVEDLHWADEATLDLLRLVARRVEQEPALVLASFRDDELDREHPLRIVLGELATAAGIERLRLPPLTLAGVRRLAEHYGAEEEELFRKTGGNPFFVTEVLAAGEARIPSTVRDAVLARVVRAGPFGRRLLEAVAIAPAGLEVGLLEILAGSDLEHFEECVASGMLRTEEGRVGFRHELARLALEDSIAPPRRVALHRAALLAFTSLPAEQQELARVAHHAEGARDAQAVLQYAQLAAERAAVFGAHREAAAQYARALRFADSLPLDARAHLLERYAYECYLADQPEEAIEARREALRCYRLLGDRRKEGESLAWLSRMLFFASRSEEAEEAGRGAIVLLEALPPGRELALAYSTLSAHRMLADEVDETIAWGGRAIELAERLNETEILAHALNNVGSAEFKAGLPGGREKLERSLELSSKTGLAEHVARAYVNLASVAVDVREYELADRYLRDGLDYAGEYDISAWRWYLLAVQARSELERGRWSEAVDSARAVLARARPTSFARLTSLVVLARVRARCGEPEAWPLLDEAREIALLNAHLQLIGPVAAARAEAAWLEHSPQRIGGETDEWFELAGRRGDAWLLGELACWRRRAGIVDTLPGPVAKPFALQLGGRWLSAAERWLEIGCPYEAALALADSERVDDLRRALSELDRLEARPAAAIVAGRLRRLGVRGLRRGPRAATRRNPGELTARELEVAALIAEGLQNAEIAERLVLSPKTVDHHVSAILRKLDLHSRRDVRAEAARLGLLAER